MYNVITVVKVKESGEEVNSQIEIAIKSTENEKSLLKMS